MKIATWNVERLKHYKDIEVIKSETARIDADILVLTETDDRLKPNYPFCFHTALLLNEETVRYKKTEKRVTVYSKYKCLAQHKTCDDKTSLCIDLLTGKGVLTVYGTIMGIFGNRGHGFKEDIISQMGDIRMLCSEGNNVCVVGDYNLSFSDNYYFTHFGRVLVNTTFRDCGISILTREQKECIDHIAVTTGFINGADVAVTEWNQDKKLSAHKGIMVEI